MTLKIKPKDALHIACTINRGCDYYIAKDKALLSKNTVNTIIINPMDFVRKQRISTETDNVIHLKLWTPLNPRSVLLTRDALFA